MVVLVFFFSPAGGDDVGLGGRDLLLREGLYVCDGVQCYGDWDIGGGFGGFRSFVPPGSGDDVGLGLQVGGRDLLLREGGTSREVHYV